MLRSLPCGVVVLACLVARSAYAQYPPITDRNYAIDFYDGVAIGNTTSVAMGGTGTAHVLGTSGVLLNPSAIAVRPTTDLDPWSLDYHFDYLTSQYSSDYDNNGEAASGGATLLTLGFGGRYHDWGLAVTGIGETTPLPMTSLKVSALRSRIVLAKWLPEYDLAIGAGGQIARFEIDRPRTLQSDEKLFSISGSSLIAGATWLPRRESFRLAAALDAPIAGGDVETSDCDPMNCDGYILPNQVRAPWRLIGGVAYRAAPTAWNQPVITPFRDEEAVTVAMDVVVTGATENGYGLEAFGNKELQRSGRHTAISVRGGLEYEWLPGRLRLRGGSYWEPARFDGIGGRLHITFGTELRVLQFHLWGPRRGRISLTADVAERYRNIGISIGFWH